MIITSDGDVTIRGSGFEVVADYLTILTALITDIAKHSNTTKAEALLELEGITLDSLDIILD